MHASYKHWCECVRGGNVSKEQSSELSLNVIPHSNSNIEHSFCFTFLLSLDSQYSKASGKEDPEPVTRAL